MIYPKKLFLIIVFIFLSGAFLTVLNGGSITDSGTADVDAEAGNLGAQIFWILVYVTVIILSAKQIGSMLALLNENKILLFFILLMLLSSLWSDVPLVTLRKTISLYGSTLLGLYLVQNYSLTGVLRIISIALNITGIFSLLAALLLPSYGIMHDLHEGAWRGVFIHKNHLGRMMVINIVCTLVLVRYDKKVRKRALYIILFSVFLIIKSQSMGALIISFVTVFINQVFRSLKLKANLFAVSVLVFILTGSVIVYYLLNNYQQILIGLGKDPTLTGRTILWSQLSIAIARKPFLGYGLGGFWLGNSGPSALVWAAVGWEPIQSHNGYFDIALDLGLLGLALFIILFLKYYARFIYRYALLKQEIYSWGLMFSTVLLIYNFEESCVLKANNIFWVLIVFTFCFYNQKKMRV
ncbi:O-antigen ligase family protein [Parafilimonas sp.]|uniref:O-antigen ligase family protein n=1 Tax=Parafilimonas sp. TaxID=1969739 RepID=UPI0039E58032